jgi:hypothetical protein
MYKTFKKRSENPKNPMKQAISGAMADRKRTMKMGVKNQPKNDGTIVAASTSKTMGQSSLHPPQKRWDNRRRDQPQNDRTWAPRALRHRASTSTKVSSGSQSAFKTT